MTETFAIGRSGSSSPFREDLEVEAEGFAAPQEPEHSPPADDDLGAQSEMFLDEAYAGPAEDVDELEAGDEQSTKTAVQGRSSIAVQAARQWDSVDRPAGWIGKVYGLVVHTTGGGLPSKAKSKGIYHTAFAVGYYSQSHGCHYVNGWRGVTGGDLLQVANEREQANGVGVGDQRRSIDQGRFEKDLPAPVVSQWRARWPGVEHPLKLLPGTRTANSCYVHVECVPCVFHHGKQLVTDAAPLRPGLRFTQAQHEAVALLACDIARRNGWPMQETWWRTARLLGHEDLTPFNRHDRAGGWDPGGMRATPYFDWDFVYSAIERECGARPAPTVSRPSWWPLGEGEAEEETAAPEEGESESDNDHEGVWEVEDEGEHEWEPEWEDEWEDERGAAVSLVQEVSDADGVSELLSDSTEGEVLSRATSGCADADLARAIGIKEGRRRNDLQGFDASFTGTDGPAFLALVAEVGDAVGLDPGLVAVSLLAEVQAPTLWLQAEPVLNIVAGVDYWHEESPHIRRAVPAVSRISERMVVDARGRPVHWRNERGNDTGPKHEFASGFDAALAVAAATSWRQSRLQGVLPPGAFDLLPAGVRFMAVRYAFNRGFGAAKRWITSAGAQGPTLLRRGDISAAHPRRTASVRAVQAMHVSQTFFGRAFPCP